MRRSPSFGQRLGLVSREMLLREYNHRTTADGVKQAIANAAAGRPAVGKHAAGLGG